MRTVYRLQALTIRNYTPVPQQCTLLRRSSGQPLMLALVPAGRGDSPSLYCWQSPALDQDFCAFDIADIAIEPMDGLEVRYVWAQVTTTEQQRT